MSNYKRLFKEIYSMSWYEINNRYKYLGEGISRRVYAIDEKYVVKIAKNNDGYFQNRVEKYIYDNAGKRYRKYLCPIVWNRKKMLVMRRALPLSLICNDNTVDISKLSADRDFVKEVNELALIFHILYEDIVATSSWGIIDKEPILIDYGCTNDIY